MHGRPNLSLLSLLAVMLMSACAPAGLLQPARQVPEGRLQVTTQASVTLPSGLARETVDEARAADENISGTLNRSELTELTNAMSGLLLHPPGGDAQLSLAYGASKRVEIGARVGGMGGGAWARFQFLRMRPGIYGSFGISTHFAFAATPIDRFTEDIEVGHARRQELSFPLTLGYSRRHVHLWVGARVSLARHDAAATACVSGDCAERADIDLDARTAYFGGELGAAFGTGRFWFSFGLSVGQMRSRAQIDAEMLGRRMEEEINRRGLLLTPSLGLIFWM